MKKTKMTFRLFETKIKMFKALFPEIGHSSNTTTPYFVIMYLITSDGKHCTNFRYPEIFHFHLYYLEGLLNLSDKLSFSSLLKRASWSLANC